MVRFSQIWHLSLLLVLISCSSFHSNISKPKQLAKKPELVILATRSSLISPGNVMFSAKIIGDIKWCPDEIAWEWPDGFSKGEVNCEKMFHNRIWIGRSSRVWIKVYHDGKLMGVEFVDIKVGN